MVRDSALGAGEEYPTRSTAIRDKVLAGRLAELKQSLLARVTDSRLRVLSPTPEQNIVVNNGAAQSPRSRRGANHSDHDGLDGFSPPTLSPLLSPPSRSPVRQQRARNVAEAPVLWPRPSWRWSPSKKRHEEQPEASRVSADAAAARRGGGPHHRHLEDFEVAWRKCIARSGKPGGVTLALQEAQAARIQALWSAYKAERELRGVKKAFRVCDRLHAKMLRPLMDAEDWRMAANPETIRRAEQEVFRREKARDAGPLDPESQQEIRQLKARFRAAKADLDAERADREEEGSKWRQEREDLGRSLDDLRAQCEDLQRRAEARGEGGSADGAS